jgi:hypothetical protein
VSKVRKDKAAWAKTDEYLTNLMDSDTMITLENTNDAIKRAQNYIDRQDTVGEKRVVFSCVADVDADNEHDEVKALRAALKDKDQRLARRLLEEQDKVLRSFFTQKGGAKGEGHVKASGPGAQGSGRLLLE